MHTSSRTSDVLWKAHDEPTAGNGSLVFGLVGVVLAQPEQLPVRGTWRWVPTHTESWPWEHPSVAQYGWTRTTCVGEFHPEMSEWGSVRGTWRWVLTLIENRPYGYPSVGVWRGISGWLFGVNLASPRNTQSGTPDVGCQLPLRVEHGGTHRSTLGPAPPGVSRSGSEITSYGSTHQERHLHAVRLERRSGVTQIVDRRSSKQAIRSVIDKFRAT